MGLKNEQIKFNHYEISRDDYIDYLRLSENDVHQCINKILMIIKISL